MLLGLHPSMEEDTLAFQKSAIISMLVSNALWPILKVNPANFHSVLICFEKLRTRITIGIQTTHPTSLPVSAHGPSSSTLVSTQRLLKFTTFNLPKIYRSLRRDVASEHKQDNFQHLLLLAFWLTNITVCNADVGIIPHQWIAVDKEPFANFNTWHKCRDMTAVEQWIHEHEIPDTPVGSDLPIPRGSKIYPTPPQNIYIFEDTRKRQSLKLIS